MPGCQTSHHATTRVCLARPPLMLSRPLSLRAARRFPPAFGSARFRFAPAFAQALRPRSARRQKEEGCEARLLATQPWKSGAGARKRPSPRSREARTVAGSNGRPARARARTNDDMIKATGSDGDCITRSFVGSFSDRSSRSSRAKLSGSCRETAKKRASSDSTSLRRKISHRGRRK